VGLSPPSEAGDDAFVIVSRQGAGDRAALKSAAAMNARYRASRRKAETLRSDLVKEGVSEAALAAIKGPAGLDISAISADEIALSILAEMVAMRRRPERPPMEDAID
jgi:xanthine dehydrogenase accessory factor